MADDRNDASPGLNQNDRPSLIRARSAACDMALRDSHVTVFAQDRSLRYTVMSGPICNKPPEEVLGRDDEAILPRGSRAAVLALKRDVLASGEPRTAEISIDDGSSISWFNLHLQPVRGEDGEIIGVGGVSVDISERKESEAHLRLLMRELTHRSKNLLAVIQAMARQTSRHAGSTDSFLEQFNARLQALAASHDLLVRESWHGASLHELVRSQLDPYLAGPDAHASINGPASVLKPEAAQSLGLALHELAANAIKYGALSVQGGTVSVTWQWVDRGLEIVWSEHAGPVVTPPRNRGFGTLVIEHNLVRAVNADVNWTFESSGVGCQIVIPASQVLDARWAAGREPFGNIQACPPFSPG